MNLSRESADLELANQELDFIMLLDKEIKDGKILVGFCIFFITRYSVLFQIVFKKFQYFSIVLQ